MVTIGNAPGGQDSSIGGSEKIPVDDAGTGKYVTIDQITDYTVDEIEAISAGTVVDGNDKIYILDNTDSALKPVDIDTVLQHIIDAVWAKAAETSPDSADVLLLKDGGATEKTVTLAYLAEYVRATIEAAILDVSDLADGSGSLATSDYLLVTQGSTAKQITVDDLNTLIYSSLKTYVDALTTVTTSVGADKFYCIQGGVEKEVSLTTIAAFIESKLPTSTTQNYIPQWDNSEGTLKNGVELVTTEMPASPSDDQVLTAAAVDDTVSDLVYDSELMDSDLEGTDVFLISDGNNTDTQKKSLISRIWTYIWGVICAAAGKTTPVGADILMIQDSESSPVGVVKGLTITNLASNMPSGTVPLASLNIDGGTDINDDLADADLMIVDDGGAGTNRKCAMSRILTYVIGTANGILKADGGGAVSAAVSGTDYQGVLSEGAFVNGDKTKLNGIEDGADVTNATNVTNAGAVMDSDVQTAASGLSDSESVVPTTAWVNDFFSHDLFLNGSEISEALVDDDMCIAFDEDSGEVYKSLISRFWTYILGKMQSVYAMSAGAGFAETGTICEHSVSIVGGLRKTEILLDLTDLTVGNDAKDIIGDEGDQECHFGQITAAINGTIKGGRVTCLETPAGGDVDIDFYSGDEGTGALSAEDADVTALTNATQLINHGAWTAGDVDELIAVPGANQYLYAAGMTGGVDNEYTAGIFLIELWGV